MSFTLNPRTGQWEVVQKPQTTPAPPKTTTTTTPKSTTTTPTTVPKTTPTTVPTPPTTVPTPPITAPKVVTPKPVLTPTQVDTTVKQVAADAQAYFDQNGVQPDSAWWAARLTTVNAAISQNSVNLKMQADAELIRLNNEYEKALKAEERLADEKARAAASGAAASAASRARQDALAKEKRDRKFQLDQELRQNQFQIDAEVRAAQRQDALAEIARIRGIEGGEAAASFLESTIGTNTFEALERIRNLYDPMQERSESDFAIQLDLLSKNFAKARGSVEDAGMQFLETFADSVAYKDVPISTFNAPTNPLLQSLKAQGAGTGEVDAITALAQSTSQSTSDLAKWATSQLNVGQQNFDAAAKNASRGATTAALQGLASREPEIGAGMRSDLNKRLNDIAMQRAGAEENVYNRETDARDRAAAIRAETLAKYGTKTKTTEKETSEEEDEAAKAAKAAEERRKKIALETNKGLGGLQAF